MYQKIIDLYKELCNQLLQKKIIKQYASLLKQKKYPFSAIYLFGFCAKDKANKWSDIDVGVISSKLKRNW